MWIETLILLLPLTVGVAQARKKYDVIDDFTENLNDWIAHKIRKAGRGNTLAAKTAQFTLIPLISVFATIHDLTDHIRDFGIKSGIRIAAYLYLVIFLFILFITFGYKVLFFMIVVFALLSAVVLLRNFLPKRHAMTCADSAEDFVERIWPYFRADSTRKKVAGLFDVQQIDVDYTGKILAYDHGDSPGKRKIGLVDQHGHIYDTRNAATIRLGRIDSQGDVIGERLSILSKTAAPPKSRF